MVALQGCGQCRYVGVECLIESVGVESRADFGGQLLGKTGQVGTVGTIETMVAGLLAQHHLHLRHLVIEVTVVVVEVFLVKIENDADMGSVMDIFELVAREFGNHNGVVVDLGEDVEERDAHVAGKNDFPCVGKGGFEDVEDERGGGAFAFGAGDGNGLVSVDLEEKVGLRGDCFGVAEPFKFHGGDAGRFDDEVVGVVFGFVEASEYFIVAGSNGDDGRRHILLDESVGAFALTAISGNEDAAVGQKVVKLLLPVHFFAKD